MSPGTLEGDWQQYLYAEETGGNPNVHDQEFFDLTGNGRLDMISMNDGTNLRWYEIPEDPTEPWIRHDIGRSIHAGISPMAFGDLNGNGYIDIVRGRSEERRVGIECRSGWVDCYRGDAGSR